MYQKIIVVGHLGGDPEMRYMPNGSPVTNFSLASSRRWTDSTTGQPVSETTWFRISVWGRQAENANQYLAKGRKVLVEGRMRPDPQTGGPRTFVRGDGTVGASFEITAESIQYLSSSSNSDRESGEYSNDHTQETRSGYASPHIPNIPEEEDDIPF